MIYYCFNGKKEVSMIKAKNIREAFRKIKAITCNECGKDKLKLQDNGKCKECNN